MSRSTVTLVGTLLLVAILLGYNYVAQPFANVSWLQPTTSQMVEETPSQLATSPLDLLSDEQKIGQLLAVPFNVEAELSATSAAQLTQIVSTIQPGIVVLFGANISTQSAELVGQQIDDIATTQTWLAVDHEGGAVQRLAGQGFTRLPSAQEMCAAADRNELTKLWMLSSQELARVGIDLVLAPVVDVSDNHPALKSRVCSDESEQVVAYAVEVISAITQSGMLPVLKHFPGIGQTRKDLHRTFDQVTVGEEEAGLYLTLLERFPSLGVMTAHVGVTNQNPDIPCSLSQSCVKELTANFPQALIITDALEMEAAGHTASGSAQLTLAERSVAAVEAGNQIVLFGDGAKVDDLMLVRDALLARYQTVPVFRAMVDRAVTQVLARKDR